MGAPGAIQAQSLAPPEVTKGQEDVGLDAVLADLTGQVSLEGGQRVGWGLSDGAAIRGWQIK